MAFWGLIVALGGLLMLLVSIPLAIAAMIAIAQWALSSGFLATLGVCVVVVAILVLLDPRERAFCRQAKAMKLHTAREHLLRMLRHRN